MKSEEELSSRAVRVQPCHDAPGRGRSTPSTTVTPTWPLQPLANWLESIQGRLPASLHPGLPCSPGSTTGSDQGQSQGRTGVKWQGRPPRGQMTGGRGRRGGGPVSDRQVAGPGGQIRPLMRQ